ncbi:hypothetical protein AFE_1132 [Acidithiobacillus ferrooxidans ATCC 23270]|uniref:Uncharacterized protein n=1 Tax=Acidithiobacillus ferrooxidans (strain ATCC 23270 / DSM 14882 / CIP 104768 / NCIMB 8455) TaxID=243159 RepID=B7J881_ACIF2|nr:hypothetical protein AFE_1132 [Acidithiobacillus ferrooxidans ATCC 23270]
MVTLLDQRNNGLYRLLYFPNGGGAPHNGPPRCCRWIAPVHLHYFSGVFVAHHIHALVPFRDNGVLVQRVDRIRHDGYPEFHHQEKGILIRGEWIPAGVHRRGHDPQPVVCDLRVMAPQHTRGTGSGFQQITLGHGRNYLGFSLFGFAQTGDG